MKEELIQYLQIAVEKDDIDVYDELCLYIERLYKEYNLLSFPVNIKELANILDIKYKDIEVIRENDDFKDINFQRAIYIIRTLISKDEIFPSSLNPLYLQNSQFDVRCFKCALLLLLPINIFQDTFFDNEKETSAFDIWLKDISSKTGVSIFGIGYIYSTINQIVEKRLYEKFKECGYDIEGIDQKTLKFKPTLYFNR